MLKDAEVGIESGDLMIEQPGTLESQTGVRDAGACLLGTLHERLHVADGPVGCVDPSWLDNAADDRHPFPGVLYVYLVRMKIHVEFILQEDADHVDGPDDVLLSTGDDRHVIDKSHISATEASHDFQSKIVKNGQEEGTEELRGDVADRHTPVRWGVEAALPWVETFPQVNPSASVAVCLRDVHQGDMCDPQERVLVVAVIPLGDEPAKLLPEDPLADIHEAGPDVYLSHVCLLRVTF